MAEYIVEAETLEDLADGKYAVIKELTNLQPTCNQLATDCISRQAAIDAIISESTADGAYGYVDTKSAVDLIERLPSAQARKETK